MGALETEESQREFTDSPELECLERKAEEILLI